MADEKDLFSSKASYDIDKAKAAVDKVRYATSHALDAFGGVSDAAQEDHAASGADVNAAERVGFDTESSNNTPANTVLVPPAPPAPVDEGERADAGSQTEASAQVGAAVQPGVAPQPTAATQPIQQPVQQAYYAPVAPQAAVPSAPVQGGVAPAVPQQPVAQYTYAQPTQPMYSQPPAASQPPVPPGVAPQVQRAPYYQGQATQQLAPPPVGGGVQSAPPAQPQVRAVAPAGQPVAQPVAQSATQPVVAQPPVQPAAVQPTAAQPTAAQPPAAQPVAQPAAQPYTPQIQQPAPYVAAQDFTVPPQPVTPAYNKSNNSTLAIVLVVVLAVLAIIAAIVFGRLLNAFGAGGSTLIEEITEPITELEEELGNQGSDDFPYFWDEENPNSSDGPLNNWYYDQDPNGYGWDYGDNYGDSHGNNYGWDYGYGDNYGDNYGWGDQYGNGYGWGYGDDSYGYNQQLPDWDDDFWDDYHGSSHVQGGGIDADDGELHNAWDANVSYKFHEETYEKEGVEKIDAYNKTVAYDFDVEYPQFEGDIPNLDAINKAIRDKAMRFVDATYTNPTDDAKGMLANYAEDGAVGVPSGVEAILESDVDYAITYNTEDFASIAFSDEYAIGSWYGEFIALRTINVNLKTGDIYELDDVLSVDKNLAESFVDNLSKFDDGGAVQAIGRDNLVDAIQGKGNYKDSVNTTYFIDGNGKVNLGVTYSLSGDGGQARGWWDVTLTDSQLNTAKKDSPIWDTLAKG